MATGSNELFELFLALAPARLQVARNALEEPDAKQREAELAGALIPLAVDAALLGAEGLSVLARTLASAPNAPEPALKEALGALDEAVVSLGEADASGGRTDESRLLALAARLTTNAPEKPEAPAQPAPADDESVWVPDLPEDMLGAFLDECVERTEGLSERLLTLEQRGAERELVDEIFRDLHTLKGSSGFAGLKKMNRVAHRAEDLVGELRDGKRPLERGLVSVLLETLDVLRAIVERARERKPIDVDVRGLLERLSDPGRAPAPQAEPEPQQRAAVAPPAGAQAPPGQGTLRIEFDKVDRLLNLVGEIVLARGRLQGASELSQGVLQEVAQLRRHLGAALGSGRALDGFSDELERTERVLRDNYRDLDAGLTGLGLAVGQLRDTVMKLRMVPIARLFSKYQRTVRELSNRLGKEVNVELAGADTELDKVLVERLEDPMLHLVRNAVDHGIEPPDVRAAAGKPRAGQLLLRAGQRGGQIFVRVSDDGRGLDAAKLRRKAVERGLLSEDEAAELDEKASFELIFLAGFSTADRLSDVSGRGVGMDVVKDAIARLKGSIEIASELGRGTTFELTLPLTLAISQVLTARVGGETIAIPLDAVVSAQTVEPGTLEAVATGTCLRQGGELIPTLDLATALGVSGVTLGEPGHGSAVVVSIGSSRVALLTQQILGRHEVVVKSLGPMLTRAPCVAGAALIGDRMVLVLDLGDLLARDRGGAGRSLAARPSFQARGRVLVAEDSDVLREAIKRELEEAGFEVTTARDGQEALELAARQVFDAISTDVMMPRLDGYELARRLREQARYRDVPIVMLTSKDARLDALRGQDAGADAFLSKPADADELIRTLLALLSRRERPADAPGTETNPS